MSEQRAFTCHHAKARGMGGSRDHSELLATCHEAHEFVEANPKIAEALGLKIRHSN